MIAIDPLTDEQGDSARRLNAWQQIWTPLVPPIRTTVPAAVAPSGTAEQDPDRPRQDSESSAESRQPAVQVSIHARPQPQQAATYSPATLHAGTSSPPAQNKEDAEFLQRLRERDQEVRAHEQAHAASLGAYAGVIQYTYQIGPDGRAYAIGGSIQVDMRQESSAAADLFKAQAIQRAAVGAGNPSDADMAVAARASEQARDAAQNLG